MNIKSILLFSAFILSLFSCTDNQTIKFGIITDLHYADRETVGTRYYSQSIMKMEEAFSVFRKSKVDFIIELGDFKDMGVTPDKDKTLSFLKSVESVFQSAGIPAYHVLGNHDMDNISKDDFLSTTSNPGDANAKAYYSFTVKGVKCIVLDANYNEDGSHYDCGNFDWTYAMVPNEEIEWLKKELNEGNEDIIVFIHQLLSKSAPACVCVQNASEIRSLFESNSRVKVVFQGHHHEGHYEEINGIHYITIPGMIEGESPENNTYVVVELDKNGRILVDGYRKCPDRILETRK